jgi:hypothetical protein
VAESQHDGFGATEGAWLAAIIDDDVRLGALLEKLQT